MKELRFWGPGLRHNMAVFTDLEASIAQLFETNEDVISKDGSGNVVTPNITGIVGLGVEQIYKVKSLAQMKSDLQMALGLPNDDDTGLDEAASDYQVFLELALSKLQLFNLYSQIQEGPGSKTYERMLLYEQEYREMKGKFNQLDINNDTNLLVHQDTGKLWK